MLPPNKPIGSVISILLYALFALIVLEKAQLMNVISNETFIDVAMWVLTGYFALGIVMNAISRSKPERFTMTPVAGAGWLCLVVALG